MSKLLTVEQWVEQRFEAGSRPSKRTVWRWIRDGRLPAERIGKRYYIDPAAPVLSAQPEWAILASKVA